MIHTAHKIIYHISFPTENDEINAKEELAAYNEWFAYDNDGYIIIEKSSLATIEQFEYPNGTHLQFTIERSDTYVM